jgi:hypothetical protein
LNHASAPKTSDFFNSLLVLWQPCPVAGLLRRRTQAPAD